MKRLSSSVPFASLFLAALLVPAVPALQAPAPAPSPGADAPAHPRDPWVFRSVLDGKARMLTIALDDEMWLAYDATHCGLAKAWRGGVRFEGAVYDARHGPQPVSVGPVYTVGYDGPVWHARKSNGEQLALEARWAGYRLAGERVTLLYDLALADGRVVRVEETPEFLHPEDRFDEATRENATMFEGDAGLWRTYRAIDPPEDVTFTLALRTDGARLKDSRALQGERFVDIEHDDGSVTTEIHSQLVLGSQLPVNHLLLFFEPLPEPEPDPVEPDREEPVRAEPDRAEEVAR
jgi:hypothetical protein